VGHHSFYEVTMVWVQKAVLVWVRDGVSPPAKGSGDVTPGNFWKFAFKILLSGTVSAKKLASVGVQNGTVRREKLVLY